MSTTNTENNVIEIPENMDGLTVSELHDHAMRLADYAVQKPFPDEKRNLFHHAMRLEREAARRFYMTPESEPTRSVLYRSAGWLAIEAGDPREALRLARAGMSSHSPKEILRELYQLQERAQSECVKKEVRDVHDTIAYLKEQGVPEDARLEAPTLLDRLKWLIADRRRLKTLAMDLTIENKVANAKAVQYREALDTIANIAVESRGKTALRIADIADEALQELTLNAATEDPAQALRGRRKQQREKAREHTQETSKDNTEHGNG